MKPLSDLKTSPAPWFITKHGEIYSQKGLIFGIKRVELGAPVVFTTDEDARLIAAAPELYDMLQSLVEYIDRECIPCGETACELMAAAHNVLAKAAGEEVRDGK